MIQIFVCIWLFAFSVVAFPAIPSWAQGENKLGLSEAELKMLTAVAERKARELGYKPEALQFEMTKEGEVFRASYYPRQRYEEKVVIYGGAINIYLDRKGQIIRIEKII